MKDFRGTAAVWVACGAYNIADATLDAADAEKSAASGDVKTASSYCSKFWITANAAMLVANAGGASATPAYSKLNEKEFADIVRAKLHPEGLESYRVT